MRLPVDYKNANEFLQTDMEILKPYLLNFLIAVGSNNHINYHHKLLLILKEFLNSLLAKPDFPIQIFCELTKSFESKNLPGNDKEFLISLVLNFLKEITDEKWLDDSHLDILVEELIKYRQDL